MLSFFISPRYPSHHGSPRETEKRRDGLKRQVNESSTRSSSRKGIQRLLFECIHLGISIRVANHRKLHSSSFTLCVCVYLWISDFIQTPSHSWFFAHGEWNIVNTLGIFVFVIVRILVSYFWLLMYLFEDKDSSLFLFVVVLLKINA